MVDQSKPGNLDRKLEMTPVKFVISFDGEVISYIEDFTFFFGYQLAAYQKACDTQNIVEISSFSGGSIQVRKESITLISKDQALLNLTEYALVEYFSALVGLLSEVVNFTEGFGWKAPQTENIQEAFEGIISDLSVLGSA